MRPLMALLPAEFVTVTRDKATLAFTFAFPILFILIFGPLMGAGGSEAARLGLVVTDDASSDLLREVTAGAGTISETDYADEAALKEAIGKEPSKFLHLYRRG